MDNIDINNIRYLQVLIPKLDDTHIESPRQDYSSFNEHLLDSMMSGLLEDDSSMELPASMTGRKKSLSKRVNKKKHSCPVCKKNFKDGETLQHHSNVSGHSEINVSTSSKTSTKKMNNCLTCGQRFKDKQTMSFHCAARGHVDPNENSYTAAKRLNPGGNPATVRKKSNYGQQEQKIVLQCSECSRRFKDTNALNFHFAMSGHANSDENNGEETDDDDEEEEEEEDGDNKKKETKTIHITKLPCGGCNKKFKDSKSLDLHLALSGHSDKREKRQSDERLEKRRSKVNGKTKHSTDGYSTKGRKIEEKHVKPYSSDSRLNCSGCRKKFKSIRELEMHCALSGHTQGKSTRKDLEVKDLGVKILKNGRSQNQSKYQTKSRSSSKSSMKCFECGKKFKTLEMLNYHEAFSGHVTQEECNSNEETLSDEDDEDDGEDSSGDESEVEQVQIVKEPSNISADILCRVCNRKFKDKNALYYHMAISGHGASKLGSDRSVKVKQSRSRIADLTSSDSSSEESDSEVSEESEDEEPTRTNDARNVKTVYKPRCGSCKKQFKDQETLEFHIALSGHSQNSTSDKRKRGRPPKNTNCKRGEVLDKCTITTSLSAKRKRGRPKKVQSSEDEEDEFSGSGNISTITASFSAKRKRGRPPKKVQCSEDEEDEVSSSGNISTNTASLSAKRKRGRPPKKVQSSEDEEEEEISRSGNISTITASLSAKRKRGRPPKKVQSSEDEEEEEDEISRSGNISTITASLSAKRKRGRPPKKVQSSEDEEEQEDEISRSGNITLKDQKRQCGECGRKCKDQHAYEFHCVMTGHGSTVPQEKGKPGRQRGLKSTVVSRARMGLSSCKSQHDSESEDSESSDDESYKSEKRKPTRKKSRMRSDSSEDDDDYEDAGKVRSYQSFMEEASVWDKWNPKKGIPCRRCGLLFKKTEDLKRHLLTTSHKTNVFE